MTALRKTAAILFLAVCVSSACCGIALSAEMPDFSFVTISDIHIPSYGFPIGQPLDEETLLQLHNPKCLSQFVEECLAMEPKPAFVMNCGDTGDIGWMPFLKLYQKMVRPLVSAGIPVYTVVGNHDLDYTGIGWEDLAEIYDPLGPAFIDRHGTRYSFDFGGCHFVVLNNRPVTGLIRLVPDDFGWLRDDLKTVQKDTRVLLFLHANMGDEDTHNIVELLQPFTSPAIFMGHRHSEAITKWGGIPVIVTGALYGGTPEAGSYRQVTVRKNGIAVRTRDFATSEAVFGPEEFARFPQPGPQLRIVEPANESFVSGNTAITVEVTPAAPGVVEFRIPGFGEGTPMQGGQGRWTASAQLPSLPGRHLITLQFKGENGAVTLAHTVVKVRGETVREVWARDLGSAVMGAPLIRKNLAIVPTIEGGVYALRLDNGDVVWRRKAEYGRIIGKIAADVDMVFYGAGRTVCACDAATGKTLWETPLRGTVIAGMTAADGRLFVPAGEHALYCLDDRSGKILWEYIAALPIMMEAGVDKEAVYFGALDGFIHALDAATGKERWATRMSSTADSYITAPFWPPVVAGDRVIAGKNPAAREEKNLVALSVSNGTVLWSRQLAGGTMRLAVDQKRNVLYAPYSENRKGGVQCLSVADGTQKWGETNGVRMSAGLVSGDVILARDAENVCCIDAASGKAMWTYHASTGSQGSYYGPGAMAAQDNLVIVGTLDGQVMALRW